MINKTSNVILIQSSFIRNNNISFNETVMTIVLKKVLNNNTLSGNVSIALLAKRCGFYNNYGLVFNTLKKLIDSEVIILDDIDGKNVNIRLELDRIFNCEYYGPSKIRFIRMPSALFDDGDIWRVINKKQFRVMLCLSTWMKDKTNGFDVTTLPVSLSVIAGYLNVTCRQLFTHVNNLKELGLIESKNVGSKYGNSYTIKWNRLLNMVIEYKKRINVEEFENIKV